MPTHWRNCCRSSRERRVHINANPIGERRVWLKMAEKNADLRSRSASRPMPRRKPRLTALQQALGLPDTAQRIECFDISHTMGEATVASCVVYDHGCDADPASTGATTSRASSRATTTAAMRQVLDRRYRKIVEGEGKLPDLILIDGGKGQVSSGFPGAAANWD